MGSADLRPPPGGVPTAGRLASPGRVRRQPSRRRLRKGTSRGQSTALNPTHALTRERRERSHPLDRHGGCGRLRLPSAPPAPTEQLRWPRPPVRLQQRNFVAAATLYFKRRRSGWGRQEGVWGGAELTPGPPGWLHIRHTPPWAQDR